MLCVLCTSSHGAAPISANGLRTFTVRDSIEMMQVLNFSGIEVNAPSASVLFSPDRSRFLLRTRRGDLKRNVNVELLLLFAAKDVAAYLATEHAGTRPVPITIVQRDVTTDHGHISHVQWVNDDEVGFVAESDAGQNQVFLASAQTGRGTQLTQSQRSVVSFAVAGDTVLYYSRVEVPALPQVVTVDDQSILELLFWNRDPRATPLQLFQASRTIGQARAINMPPMRLISASERIWISPTGHHAVVLAPSVDAPRHWGEYQVPNYDMFGYTPDKVESDPTSWDLIDRTRYLLIDLGEGTARPLLDAPTGWHARNCTPLEVFWTRDGQSVIVSNTFLPLDSSFSPVGRNQRAEAPAIAEIDIRSGVVTPILFEPPCAGDARQMSGTSGPIVSVQWNSRTSSLIVRRSSAYDRKSYERYQRSRDRWRQTRAYKQRDAALPQIERIEGLNKRPKVYATGGNCQCTKEIFDPAPEADELVFARSQIAEWKDRNGIAWRGALLLPPSHVSGQQHPLVLQTHGFRPDEFLVDGAYGVTTAMAAQALASAGIAVLQIEDNERAETLDEAALFAEGFRAAADTVVERGIADPAKLGLVAFSRTGLPAVRLLADYPDLFAAVNLADANWWGYLQDLLLASIFTPAYPITK